MQCETRSQLSFRKHLLIVVETPRHRNTEKRKLTCTQGTAAGTLIGSIRDADAINRFSFYRCSIAAEYLDILGTVSPLLWTSCAACVRVVEIRQHMYVITYILYAVVGCSRQV